MVITQKLWAVRLAVFALGTCFRLQRLLKQVCKASSPRAPC